MEFRQSTPVISIDGHEVGTIERVVMDPQTKEISYLIVQQGMIFADHKVVPMTWVSFADKDRIILREPEKAINSLPQFEVSYYVPVDETEIGRTYPASQARPIYWYPFGAGTRRQSSQDELRTGQPHQTPVTARNTPNYTVALEEGAAVLDASGEHVGNVARIFADAENERATHFAISQGLLFKAEKLVPATWVESIGEGEIRLAVHGNTLAALPDYAPAV